MKRRAVLSCLLASLATSVAGPAGATTRDEERDIETKIQALWLSTNFLLAARQNGAARTNAEGLYALIRQSDRWTHYPEAFLLGVIMMKLTSPDERMPYFRACMVIIACWTESGTYGDLAENLCAIAQAGWGALKCDAGGAPLLTNAQRQYIGTVGLAYCGVAFGQERKAWAQTCLAATRKYGLDQSMLVDPDGATLRLLAAGTAAAGEWKDAAKQYEALIDKFGQKFDAHEKPKEHKLKGLMAVVNSAATIEAEAGSVMLLAGEQARGIELLEISRSTTLSKAKGGLTDSATGAELERELIGLGVVVVQVCCNCAGEFVMVSRRGKSGQIERFASFTAVSNSFQLFLLLMTQKVMFLSGLDGLAPSYLKIRKAGGKKAQTAFQNYVDRASAIASLAIGVCLRTALRSASIGPHDDVLIILPGSLGFLPISLAKEDPDGPFLCQEYQLRFTDSLRSAVNSARATVTPPDASVAVLTSDPPSSDLQYLPFEATSVGNAFPAEHRRRVASSDDPEVVLTSLDGASYWHVASHAAWNFDKPDQSGLALSRKKAGTVRNVLDLELKAPPRLVYLSACETAMVDVHQQLTDYVNLPMAFLSAGSAGVVGSLWAVSDAATSLLACKFYDLHRSDFLEPAAALSRAQQWLATATSSDLLTYVTGKVTAQVVNPDDVGRLSTYLSGLKADDRPFHHPYFWGGFQMYGA